MPRVLILCVVGCALVGCNPPAKRLNAPPHGAPMNTTDMQGTFTYMIDNAMLENMTVTDIHFLPHRKQLSSLGQERMARMASLMKAYGGTLRYNTAVTDEGLLAARMETLMDFLAEAGLDTSGEILVRDLQGGEGMNAPEAILIRTLEGAYQPKDASASSSTSGEQAEPKVP